ncbi:hypothetical protein Glove_165g110 [Diversispora epigaea]|uniref:Transmembrane protein n=1 Tax=Diversispora epigaea TaxID=1348612 RepID=A0A397IQZ4_9GLOM|nr:hypothetical protein Glove_165g110 [Diversispora epigaea]
MQSSLNLMVLLIAWITIFSLTSSVSGIFTHNEANPFDTPPRIWQYGKYFDGTVVIRIISRNPNKTHIYGEVWVKPVLSLRIIYSNGTVSEIDKDLEIQEFNWHITTSPGGDYLDPINIFALQKGFLLVRYFNASNTDDINTYEERGRIIDWNGNLYDEVNFGGAYIENDIWYPTGTTIVINIDPEKGLIRVVGRNVIYIEWQQYMIDDSFNLKNLTDGKITLPQSGTSAVFNTVATVDEGYSIIIGNFTNSTNSDSFLELYATVYDLKIEYNNTQFSTPKLLYQLPLPNITLSNIFCGISSSGIGQVCILNATHNGVTSYVKLDFLSSGFVTKITPLSKLPKLPSSYTTGWSVESIPYGGYLFYGSFFNGNQTNTYGYYLNEIENKFTEWDFPEPSVLNVKGILLILPNNTMLVSQIESLNTWSFFTTDIPKYSVNSDNGYSNLLINSTNPPINAIIQPTDMSNITITYYDPVELSDGYIWIYQVDNNGNNFIRQYVDGGNKKYCSISESGLTVTVKVIKSTFSNPSSQFYVKVDNNFVRSKALGEPLMGINDNIWKFNTYPSEKTIKGTNAISGVLRLTIEGTEYYENLDSTGKSNFFSDLQIILSEIIPVNIKQLSSNEKTQIDGTISRQIIFSLNIQSSKERSIKSIIDDLDDMIKYKSITSISLFPTTNYLDEVFGFEQQNLWNKCKWGFLGVILTFAFLVFLFSIANGRTRHGRNMAIFQLGFIIYDFVLDVIFVSVKGRVVVALYIPSVVFLTVPIGINIIWAYYIFSKEKKSECFFNWFSHHGKVASVFIGLSGADIDALSILHSNIAGLEMFQAPFSTKGKFRIFWLSCLTIFVGDIPQFIIQILYSQSVVTYDIIPLLTLFSSCLFCLLNIIGSIYGVLYFCRHQTSQSQEDFGGFQPLQNHYNFREVQLLQNQDASGFQNQDTFEGFKPLPIPAERNFFQEVIP